MATESDLPEFHSLYKLTVQRAGGNPYPYTFFETIWRTLKQSFKVLLVREAGRVVAGSGFLCFPERKLVHLVYTAFAEDMTKREAVNLYAIWKTIVWTSENGYHVINTGTTSTNPRDGVHRFKKQFGGKLFEKKSVRFILLR